MSSLLLFFAFFTILDNSIATDCTLPSKSRLDVLLQTEVDNSGSEGGLDISPLNDTYYTCLVQGNTKGTYQDLSVIMQYTVPGSSDPSTRTRQFEAFCSGGIDWEAVSSSLTTPPNNYMSIGLRTDCSDCDNTAGNDNHCIACDSSCTEGLMRCTSDSSSDCCAAFEEDGTCKTDLDCNQPNFVANEQNIYTCACRISSCEDGYTFNSSSCSCYLSDICAAITPCDNGECILGSSADIYTCNCTGTNFMGTNCSDCQECPFGYNASLKNNCKCLQTHICLVNNPCQNGGNCSILNGDTNYTCTCTDYYTGDNCTDICTSECNPLSDQLPYEECCEPRNLGQFVRIVKHDILRGYMSCPVTRPDWC